MKRLILASPIEFERRLQTLRASFEQNAQRYSLRRRVAIKELLGTATSEDQLNALNEALDAWLPTIDRFDHPTPAYPRAMAA